MNPRPAFVDHPQAASSSSGSVSINDNAPTDGRISEQYLANDRSFLRVGAVAAGLGIVVQIVMTFLHPSHAAPNDSAAAFEEYSHSSNWAYVHIGQFIGTLLIVVALVALSRALSRQPGIAGALALIGGISAILVGAVFAVQMAVDGVALKGAIDTWAHATSAADKATDFQVADGIRWIEKALSSFFHLVNGLTLLALGTAAFLARRTPRWLGAVGVLAGIAFVLGSTVVARTGFSPQSQPFLLPALVMSAVFIVGASVSMARDRRATT